jgi:tRNA (adenine57-N1/adenine58-N1)-methyltransferase
MEDVSRLEHAFREGEYALVLDRRGRKYLTRLKRSSKFESHLGAFLHDDLIGKDYGSWVTTNRGHHLLAM